jgi:hypothetical protein
MFKKSASFFSITDIYITPETKKDWISPALQYKF